MTSTDFLNAKLEYYSKYDIELWVIVQMVLICPLTWECISLFAGKANWMQCPLHNKKVNKPVPIVPDTNWHNPTSQHTKHNTCEQQCIGSKCSLWYEDDNHNKACWNQFLSPICLPVTLNTEALVVVVVVAVCRAFDHRSPLLAAAHTASFWHKMPVTLGYKNKFQESVLKYRLSMFCQNCVTSPSIRTDPGIPPPGYSALPRRDPGIRPHTGTFDRVWQPILNLYSLCYLRDDNV